MKLRDPAATGRLARWLSMARWSSSTALSCFHIVRFSSVLIEAVAD